MNSTKIIQSEMTCASGKKSDTLRGEQIKFDLLR